MSLQRQVRHCDDTKMWHTTHERRHHPNYTLFICRHGNGPTKFCKHQQEAGERAEPLHNSELFHCCYVQQGCCAQYAVEVSTSTCNMFKSLCISSSIAGSRATWHKHKASRRARGQLGRKWSASHTQAVRGGQAVSSVPLELPGTYGAGASSLPALSRNIFEHAS